MIDCNSMFQRYPALFLFLVVNVLISPDRKCKIHIYDTAPLTHVYFIDTILTRLVLVLGICSVTDALNVNCYRMTFNGMPATFCATLVLYYKPGVLSLLFP